MAEDPLKTALLDLLWELRETRFRLILGGGYGLYLRQLHLQGLRGYRPLISMELWPPPRATKDLDILLPTEVVASVERSGEIRKALDRLGYGEKVKFTQFVKNIGGTREVKIDFLTGPITNPKDLKRIHSSARRVRPKSVAGEGKIRLHAAPAPEAVDFEANVLEVAVEGERSGGIAHRDVVQLMQPFSLLLMKLHAFRDQKDDGEKDFGRHHAMDLYRTVAMLSESEYGEFQAEVRKHVADPVVESGRRIVRGHFGNDTSMGLLRLREHSLFRGGMDVARFMSELARLLS